MRGTKELLQGSQCPHIASPSQDDSGTGQPAVATLTGGTGCPGGHSPSPRGALPDGVTPFPALPPARGSLGLITQMASGWREAAAIP